MKLVPVLYFGFTAMDRRFSSPMLPWIVSEIRKRDFCEKLSVGVDDGLLQAYNHDFELQFTHKVVLLSRFSQADQDPTTFLYLLRDDVDQLLYCYLYQARKASDVSELYRQMKEQTRRYHNNHSCDPEAGVQRTRSYPGVSLPPPKRSQSTTANLTSLCVDISATNSNFFEVLYIGKIRVSQGMVPDSFIDDALERFRLHELEKLKINSTATTVKPKLVRSQTVIGAISDGATRSREEKSSSSSTVDLDDHNRTMVLQVDRTDLRLISPDRKVILLHKHDQDVTACIQGLKSTTHFGFICRDASSTTTKSDGSGTRTTTNINNSAFMGYVFKCDSNIIAREAVAVINQAFCWEVSVRRPAPDVTLCDQCPMLWFHRLCTEVEPLADRRTQTTIFRRLEELSGEEQTSILVKFRGAETDSVREQNEFLMMLLRAHCEMKQGQHVHDLNTTSSTSYSNANGEKRSGSSDFQSGTTMLMKAMKRSFSSSIDLWRRRTSKDELNLSLKESSADDKSSIEENCSEEIVPRSPMLEIFRKIGAAGTETTVASTETVRQAIFKQITNTPTCTISSEKKRTSEEWRELWRNAIYQAILLVRMERENANLKAKQEESAVKRIKLEYDELTISPPIESEYHEIWKVVPTTSTTSTTLPLPLDADSIYKEAIRRRGVPRGKRGTIWRYLAEQYCRHVSFTPPAHLAEQYYRPYEVLLKQLTAHQHAILIDLGRTFPNHSYFSSPLGPGQLALFNLLKAYSLLDTEMGYCQGLSFLAGVLLLHTDESTAFDLLKHLMFERNLRGQYLPDMIGLQIKLYQLSRLMHDHVPDLYHHLDRYEVGPTLYAAPWLLTMFASQFPLGFVARIFDAVLLDGTDCIFRVVLALLTHHRQRLLGLDSFDEIIAYLKDTVPAVNEPTMAAVLFEYHPDLQQQLRQQLHDYEVEYHVLREEMSALEDAQRLTSVNRVLLTENKTLARQLEAALANVARLERTRAHQQSHLNRLEMHNRQLAGNLNTLVSFLGGITEPVPEEIRRILAQIDQDLRTSGNNGVEGKHHRMIKSLSTGRLLQQQPSETISGSSSTSVATKEMVRSISLHHNSSFFSHTLNNILNNKSTTGATTSKVSGGGGTVFEEEEVDDTVGQQRSSPSNSIDSGVGTPSSPQIQQQQ